MGIIAPSCLLGLHKLENKPMLGPNDNVMMWSIITPCIAVAKAKLGAVSPTLAKQRQTTGSDGALNIYMPFGQMTAEGILWCQLVI